MTDETVAYQRPTRPDWRHRIENALNRAYDAYTALWDIMPAIAGIIFLIWLTTWIPRR